MRCCLLVLPISLAVLSACNKHVDPYAFDSGGAAAAAPSASDSASAAASAAPSAPAAADTGGDLAPLNAGATPAVAQGGKPHAAASAAPKPGVIPECETAKSAICANPTGSVLRASCASAKSTCLQKGGKL